MNEVYIGEMIAYLSGNKKDFDLERIIYYFIEKKEQKLRALNKRQFSRLMISELNYEMRSELKSSEPNGFKVRVGDICYIDFGRAYITEAGFQHFAIVIGYCNSKALVVPMSSNYSMYNQSYCPRTFTNGKKHLYRLPPLDGLHKRSVLFLNDIKYINTARIIAIKGNIATNTGLFNDILKRVTILV